MSNKGLHSSEAFFGSLALVLCVVSSSLKLRA